MPRAKVKDQHVQSFKEFVSNLDVSNAVKVAENAKKEGISATEFIDKVVMPIVEDIWAEYRKGESGLPGPVTSMYIAHQIVDLFRDQLPPFKGKVVIGTTGTFHDLGKNLVKEMLYLHNYDVYDIHSNAEPEDFVKKALEVDADIIACNCMALSARPNTAAIVEKMKEAGVRNRIKFMVGGAVMTPEWAREIGADGYGDTMMDAAVLADRFMRELKKGE
jgi:methanogenic corrinoid protein MtbC1